VPPSKEQTVTLNTRQPDTAQRVRDVMDPNYDDEAQSSGKPRIPPPVQPAQPGAVRRDVQPSVSIEQAAKPRFDITVGDPHKVGDLTSSHIVYQVRTKVWTRFDYPLNGTDDHENIDYLDRLQATRILGNPQI
jgi:sorting nexin-1/2